MYRRKTEEGRRVPSTYRGETGSHQRWGTLDGVAMAVRTLGETPGGEAYGDAVTVPSANKSDTGKSCAGSFFLA